MRLIFSILTAIVVLILGLVFAAPMFISADDVRSELFARVEQMTGYRLRVSGPLDITVFPSLALVAEDVGIAQPEATGGQEFATAKKVRFDLLLTGLLQGKVRVREVTLITPVVQVPDTSTAQAAPMQAPPMQAAQPGMPAGGPGVAPAGQPGQAPVQQAQPSQPQSQGGGSGMAEFAEQLKTVSLDKLIIRQGTVTLPPSDGKPGTRIEGLDVTASLPGYDESLTLETKAVVDGKPIELAAAIGRFGPFLGGATVPVRLKATLKGTLDDPLNVSGSVSYKDDTLTLPQFSAKSGNKTLSGAAVYKDGVARVTQLTGTMGQDTFAGSVLYQNNTVAVNPLRANVRGTVVAGQVHVDLNGQVPLVRAALGTKTIDINKLTGASSGASSRGGAKPAAGGGGAKKSGGGNRAGGGKRGGGTASSGWSNEKIDFSALRKVNANINLRAEQLIYDQVKISPVSLQATLNGGVLNARLGQFGLYGGTGTASVTLNASGGTPSQKVVASLQNLDGYAFLKDAAGMESIEGKGAVSVNLNAAGASQRAIVGALSGNAKVEFTNGAIRGVNIAKMIRNLGQGAMNGWQGAATEKTDFASLGASFQINKGIAQTNDIHLQGPLVQVAGGGTIDLPRKSLKLRVDPQLVASLEGQGRQGDAAGLGVPVMIVGPWASPKIYPDIKGILEDPAGAIARYKQFGKDLKNLPGGLGGAAGALDGVVKDGKVDQQKLIEGIGGLLGGGAAATPDAAAAPGEAAQAGAGQNNKNKKNKKKNKKLKPEDVGKQLLNNWLSGQ